MDSVISVDYQLNSADYLEANTLHMRHSRNFYGNTLTIILLLYSTVLSFYRINNPDLLYWKNFIQHSGSSLEEVMQAEVVSAILFLLCLIFIIGETFPKVSPLSRWLNRRKLDNNFVRRELKQINISSSELAITSQNCREIREWQSFERVLENKKIFLLYHSRNSECIIVPKRIFGQETEARYLRSLLNNE